MPVRRHGRSMSELDEQLKCKGEAFVRAVRQVPRRPNCRVSGPPPSTRWARIRRCSTIRVAPESPGCSWEP